MRTLLVLLMNVFIGVAAAQTPINESYAVRAGQSVSFKFDYPKLIKITTWDKNEIAITGTVSINSGEHDDALEFIHTASGNEVVIENKIRNMKELPQRITITRGAEKITFKSKADYQKYCEEHGRNFNTTTMGVDIDIFLEIKIPKNVKTKMEATYGLVEVVSFTGQLEVNAIYGGVDAAVAEKTIGELSAQTGYGQIYSNLDVKFTGSEFRDFHTHISGKPGSGPAYRLESKYGNVYLRKAL